MSAVSSFVTALSMALVSFVRCRFGATFGARHSCKQRHLAEPQLDRLGRRPGPSRPRRNIRMDIAGAGKLCALAYRHMVAHTNTPAQHYEILERRASGDTGLRRHDAMPTDSDIVADLDQVVDLGALADHGIANGAAVDRCAGADLNIILDDDAPDLWHLEVPFASHHEAEAILTDLTARMNDDPVADQRVGDDRPGPDRTIAPDAHLGSDHRRRPDDAAAADFGPRPDHRPGLDRDVIFQPRGRVHMGAGHRARFGERGRPQRMWKQFAHQHDESAIGR